MFDFSKSTARQWSRIGPRGIYGQSLLEIAKNDKNIFAISADLGNSSGLERFSASIPERFLNIGIAEQNMVGFSSGLSTLGFNVFISSFAPFITMRAGEQVRMNLSYMQSNVKLVSIGSGISMGYLGNSHFGLEDISIINSLPEIPIICPSDCLELKWIYLAAVSLPEPEAPVINTLLFVRETLSNLLIKCRNVLLSPINSKSRLSFFLSSLFSLRNEEVSIARRTTTKSCSILKGFSIKS